MIRNVVFDLGNVLVDFDPKAYLHSFGFGQTTVDALMQTVFRDDWPLYDRGDYPTVQALCEAVCAKYPAFAVQLRQVLRPDWVGIHTLYEDTAAYLAALKARGYHVFLLSNLAKESYDYISRFDFFRQIDGGVFSFQEHVCKPDERIYHILLGRCHLQPEETVFLDDSAANIAAAERCGMHGIVFTGLPAAKAKLETLLQTGNQTDNGENQL